MSQTFTISDVQKVAKLASIPITDAQAATLASGFTTTMGVVEQLSTIDTTGREETHHTTGLENVTRDDVVDEERMFTQEQALMNAPRTYNGFFVVNQVIEQSE